MPMQLDLGKNELGRLSDRVEEDYQNDLSAHERRIERFRRYYQRWRNRVDAPASGEEDEPNFSVPMVQWNVLYKLADDIGKLIGADAEIVAKPVGPCDQRIAKKIGRYMTWRVFSAMKLTNPFAVFLFNKTLFGRAHAYRPWVRDTYPILHPLTKNVEEAVHYEGPGFYPLWPDALILPDERNVQSIQDFSHVIRRYRIRPDGLLRGESAGRYFGIKDRFQEIVECARGGTQRETHGEEIQQEADEIQGVDGEGYLQSGETVTVLEWYGRWRMLKRRKDAREDNLDARNLYEDELVIRCIPDLDYMVVGAQNLMELYPTMRNRRPFSEASLIKDGSYWSPGFGELLESIEDETTVNHRLFTKAGMFSVGPVVFFKPGSGFDPDTFSYSPNQAIPTEDPTGVHVVQMQADLQYPIANAQTLGSYAEKVTGNSDFSMGRQSDRPNAPRTARGTMALLEQGNVRANLDTVVLREDMGLIVSDLFTLEQQFPITAKTFFRVTEEEAGGLFPVDGAGAYIMPDEMGGKYDFDLKFATSVWSREAEKERKLALYQLDLANPLIAQNPKALWKVTSMVHGALGDDNFADIVPEPPDLMGPRSAKEEWTLALQGEEILVHPDDHDELHVRQHRDQISREYKSERQDEDAIRVMLGHMKDHEEQYQKKLMRQVLVQQLVNRVGDNVQNAMGALGAVAQQEGQPGAPGQQQGNPLQALQQGVGQIAAPEAGMGEGAAQAAPNGPIEGAAQNIVPENM